MGVVALYFTTVRSQRKFDVLYEQDLRAYYLGESGFQYTVGRLYKSRRYEERWYQPKLSVSLRKEFRYTEQQGHGVFQTYLTQVNEKENFSHLFLLSKGIFFSGKTRRDGLRERVIAIIKGNLAYSPKPPSEEEQVLFVVDKSPLTQSELLRFIIDPKFKHLFAVDNGVIPSKIRSLLEFLKTNNVEDIDFSSEIALMQGIAQLDRLNQKIKYLKRVSSYTTLKTSVLDEQPYFPEQVPEDKPISFLSQQDFKLFNDLILSGKNIDQLYTLFSSKLIPLSNKRKASLLGSESLNLLKYVSPNTVVTLDAKLNQSLRQPEKLTVEQFRTLIKNKSENLEEIKALLDSETMISSPSTKDFELRDLNSVSGLTKLIEAVGDSNLLDQSDKVLTNALAVVNDNEFDKTANSDQNVLPADDQSEELLNSDPGDILDNIDINNPEEQDRFLSRLYHPIFEGIQIDEGVYDEDLATGFLKIFKDSLHSQLEEFILQTQLTWDRDPTPEEYKQFREQYSIPSRETITKIGNILDDLFNSNEYTFHHGANVLKSNSYNTAGGIYTVVERRPDTMHTELQNKLTTYYFTHGAKTDEQFLAMFKKSTWGDSSSANSIRKSDEFYASKHKTDYFIRHKTTGNEMKLHDYIRSQI